LAHPASRRSNERENVYRAGTDTRYFCGDDLERLVRYDNVANQDIAKVFKKPKMIVWKDGGRSAASTDRSALEDGPANV
jgi:hypothetical protein